MGLSPWAALLPGRLLHVNVIGCSIFAAISGSSAATTQVVGRISLAELLKRGYSKDVAVGSLAGAGTLGFLIPPSNIMIIYGVLGDVSIAKLFTAGFIPGFLLAAQLHGLDHDPYARSSPTWCPPPSARCAWRRPRSSLLRSATWGRRCS